MTYVLDASALLAALKDGPGAERLAPLGDETAVSTVNLAEVASVIIRHGNS